MMTAHPAQDADAVAPLLPTGFVAGRPPDIPGGWRSERVRPPSSVTDWRWETPDGPDGWRVLGYAPGWKPGEPPTVERNLRKPGPLANKDLLQRIAATGRALELLAWLQRRDRAHWLKPRRRELRRRLKRRRRELNAALVQWKARRRERGRPRLDDAECLKLIVMGERARQLISNGQPARNAVTLVVTRTVAAKVRRIWVFRLRAYLRYHNN